MGIILKNENQLEGMVSIMETLEQFVPCIRKSETVPSVDTESTEPDIIEIDHFHHILFGGDQLTCARARGAQRIRQNSLVGQSRLEGFVPVVEDWHAKACLLGVSVYFVEYSCIYIVREASPDNKYTQCNKNYI